MKAQPGVWAGLPAQTPGYRAGKTAGLPGRQPGLRIPAAGAGARMRRATGSHAWWRAGFL